MLRRPFEKAARFEKARDEQDAKQEHDDVEIDGGVRVVQRQTTDRHYRHRAKQRGSGTVQAAKRYPLNGDQQVRDDKNGETDGRQGTRLRIVDDRGALAEY